MNHGSGRSANVIVPGNVVQAAKAVVGSQEASENSWVTLPALMSRGDVRNHQDLWNGRPSAFVNSHTVIIWLRSADSQLILEGTHQQQVVDAVPGRLVAFNNRCFSHAVHGTETVRAMLGPMALQGSGTSPARFGAVMDAPGFSEPKTCCQFMCCFCCLCCAIPCLLCCESIGDWWQIDTFPKVMIHYPLVFQKCLCLCKISASYMIN